jgi:hypothetical protein
MDISPVREEEGIDVDIKMNGWITNITSSKRMLKITASHVVLVASVRYLCPDLRVWY